MSQTTTPSPRTAEEALERLLDGNERFVSGRSDFPGNWRQALARLAAAQRPWATILGCSDSRVPPELIFDAGLGDLFIVRIAGNLISPEVAGTLQYAGTHLETPLFVVLGHEGCGAVRAALGARLGGAPERARIRLMLDSILPALEAIDPQAPPETQLARAVEANVRWSLRQIAESPEGRERLAEGRMKLVGAIYDLETGRVRVLEPAPGAGVTAAARATR